MEDPQAWPFNDGVLFFSDLYDDGQQGIFSVTGGDRRSKFYAKHIGECHTNCTVDDDGVIRVSCDWFPKGPPRSAPSLAKFAVLTMKYSDHLGKPRQSLLESDSDTSGRGKKNKISSEKGASSLRPQDFERRCDLCCDIMQQGMDVSALLDYKEGELFCSSNNPPWSEYDMWINASTHERDPTRPKLNKDKDIISFLYCPGCHDTGKQSEGAKQEKIHVTPKSPFLKQKRDEAREAWVRDSKGNVQKASPGLQFKIDFCSQQKVEGKDDFGKCVLFYRGDPDKRVPIMRHWRSG